MHVKNIKNISIRSANQFVVIFPKSDVKFSINTFYYLLSYVGYVFSMTAGTEEFYFSCSEKYG